MSDSLPSPGQNYYHRFVIVTLCPLNLMKVMSIIHFLVRLHVIIAVVGHHDHLLRAAHRLDAVPDDAEDDGESPVQSQEMTVLHDGADWINRHGGVEEGGEGGGGGLEGQQEVQGGGADQTALR